MTIGKVRFPGPGCVVEYIQGNSVATAFVLDEQGGRLRLYGTNRRETTLQASRLLPWSGQSLRADFSRKEIEDALEERSALREKLTGEIDPLELWEMIVADMDRVSAEWLAGLVWSEATIDHEAAVGRALLACRTHFRFSPPDFEVFSAEQVEKRLEDARLASEREALAAAGIGFFRKLWDMHQKNLKGADESELPDAALVERLKELLLKRIGSPEDSESESTWKQLTGGLPDSPHLALHLAVAWGIVPEHYNFMLDRAGYESGEDWAEAYASDCEALGVKVGAATDEAEAKEAIEPFGFVSIDPEQSLDRDDAFFVAAHPGGGWRAVIALACPAMFWNFNSGLDKAALRRATSLYLPEGVEHMLPERAGRGLFSLDAGKTRPGLIVDVLVSADGAVENCEFRPSFVRVAANLSLCESESLLTKTSVGGASPLKLAEQASHAAMLEEARALVLVLRSWRIAAGAVITERPDPEIILHERGKGPEVEIFVGPETPESHTIVGELMILANALAGEKAFEWNVPLLHRTQDVALPKEFAGIWTEPHEISKVVRSMPPATLQLQAKRHAGLGLLRYAPMTSPIRRYTDLLNQGQVINYLRHGQPMLSQDSLAAIFPLISARQDEVGQIQRQRPRYWKILFFRQNGDKKWWDAVVTDENEVFVFVSMPWAHQIVRAKRQLFGEKTYPGQQIQVRLGKTNPLQNEIMILESREY